MAPMRVREICEKGTLQDLKFEPVEQEHYVEGRTEAGEHSVLLRPIVSAHRVVEPVEEAHLELAVVERTQSFPLRLLLLDALACGIRKAGEESSDPGQVVELFRVPLHRDQKPPV